MVRGVPRNALEFLKGVGVSKAGEPKQQRRRQYGGKEMGGKTLGEAVVVRRVLRGPAGPNVVSHRVMPRKALDVKKSVSAKGDKETREQLRRQGGEEDVGEKASDEAGVVRRVSRHRKALNVPESVSASRAEKAKQQRYRQDVVKLEEEPSLRPLVSRRVLRASGPVPHGMQEWKATPISKADSKSKRSPFFRPIIDQSGRKTKPASTKILTNRRGLVNWDRWPGTPWCTMHTEHFQTSIYFKKSRHVQKNLLALQQNEQQLPRIVHTFWTAYFRAAALANISVESMWLLIADTSIIVFLLRTAPRSLTARYSDSIYALSTLSYSLSQDVLILTNLKQISSLRAYNPLNFEAAVQRIQVTSAGLAHRVIEKNADKHFRNKNKIIAGFLNVGLQSVRRARLGSGKRTTMALADPSTYKSLYDAYPQRWVIEPFHSVLLILQAKLRTAIAGVEIVLNQMATPINGRLYFDIQQKMQRARDTFRKANELNRELVALRYLRMERFPGSFTPREIEQGKALLLYWQSISKDHVEVTAVRSRKSKPPNPPPMSIAEKQLSNVRGQRGHNKSTHRMSPSTDSRLHRSQKSATVSATNAGKSDSTFGDAEDSESGRSSQVIARGSSTRTALPLPQSSTTASTQEFKSATRRVSDDVPSTSTAGNFIRQTRQTSASKFVRTNRRGLISWDRWDGKDRSTESMPMFKQHAVARLAADSAAKLRLLRLRVAHTKPRQVDRFMIALLQSRLKVAQRLLPLLRLFCNTFVINFLLRTSPSTLSRRLEPHLKAFDDVIFPLARDLEQLRVIQTTLVQLSSNPLLFIFMANGIRKRDEAESIKYAFRREGKNARAEHKAGRVTWKKVDPIIFSSEVKQKLERLSTDYRKATHYGWNLRIAYDMASPFYRTLHWITGHLRTSSAQLQELKGVYLRLLSPWQCHLLEVAITAFQDSIGQLLALSDDLLALRYFRLHLYPDYVTTKEVELGNAHFKHVQKTMVFSSQTGSGAPDYKGKGVSGKFDSDRARSTSTPRGRRMNRVGSQYRSHMVVRPSDRAASGGLGIRSAVPQHRASQTPLLKSRTARSRHPRNKGADKKRARISAADLQAEDKSLKKWLQLSEEAGGSEEWGEHVHVSHPQDDESGRSVDIHYYTVSGADTNSQLQTKRSRIGSRADR